MKTWIYHETEEPKIIDQSNYEEAKKDGWLDSPAPFIKYEDVGIDSTKIKSKDEQELLKASQVFQTVEGLIDYANGELNLDDMSKQELEDYARKHFETELDKRRSKKRLVAELRELMNGDS
jgi:hypothetical protein